MYRRATPWRACAKQRELIAAQEKEEICRIVKLRQASGYTGRAPHPAPVAFHQAVIPTPSQDLAMDVLKAAG